MKPQLVRVCARIFMVLAVLVGILTATGVKAEDGRRVRNKVNPVYPDLARKVNASGAVRLEIEIAPNGEVRSVKALGGHPLLIPAAQDAIRKWRYEPAPETTTTIVEFRFSPNS